MITCPNCGATARNGAKFCTTCGTRLTGIAPTSQTSPATTAAAGESNQTPIWSWPPITEATPTEAVSATTEPTASTSEVEWDWPAPFSAGGTITEDEPTSEEAAPVETVAEGDSQPNGASPTSEHDDLTAWAAQWNAGNDVQPTPANASPSETTNAPLDQSIDPPVERIDDILVEHADPAAIASSNAPDDAIDPGFETTSFNDEHDETPDIQVSEAPVPEHIDVREEAAVSQPITQPDTPSQEPVDVPAAPANDATASRLAASTATRATALLDELRDLLTACSSTEAGADGNALPPEIATSLRDAMGDGSSLDALRAVATQANEHPRDLYAMMDLGRHAGDILDLITERDRLRAAITEALASRSSRED